MTAVRWEQERSGDGWLAQAADSCSFSTDACSLRQQGGSRQALSRPFASVTGPGLPVTLAGDLAVWEAGTAEGKPGETRGIMIHECDYSTPLPPFLPNLEIRVFFLLFFSMTFLLRVGFICNTNELINA